VRQVCIKYGVNKSQKDAIPREARDLDLEVEEWAFLRRINWAYMYWSPQHDMTWCKVRKGGRLRRIYTVQRHNTKNVKQIFPEKELRRHSPNSYTFMFLWAIYIFPRSVCLFCCRKIGVPSVRIYSIARSQIHECGSWDWGLAIPFLGIHKSKFLCLADNSLGYRCQQGGLRLTEEISVGQLIWLDCPWQCGLLSAFLEVSFGRMPFIKYRLS
jgi:hypothetical protein